MTTQNKSEVVASVSSSTAIPPRPTLYIVLYPHSGGWCVGTPWSDIERARHRAANVPGAVIVTIPSDRTGSAEQTGKDNATTETLKWGCWIAQKPDGYFDILSPSGKFWFSRYLTCWEEEDSGSCIGRWQQEQMRDVLGMLNACTTPPPDFTQPEPPKPCPECDSIHGGRHVNRDGHTCTAYLKVRPWPEDLKTLIGKRITQMPKERHREAMGDGPETGLVVRTYDDDTLNVRLNDGRTDDWTIDYRDLLEIHDAEPENSRGKIVAALRGLLGIIHDDITHARQRDHADAIEAAKAALASLAGEQP